MTKFILLILIGISLSNSQILKNQNTITKWPCNPPTNKISERVKEIYEWDNSLITQDTAYNTFIHSCVYNDSISFITEKDNHFNFSRKFPSDSLPPNIFSKSQKHKEYDDNEFFNQAKLSVIAIQVLLSGFQELNMWTKITPENSDLTYNFYEKGYSGDGVQIEESIFTLANSFRTATGNYYEGGLMNPALLSGAMYKTLNGTFSKEWTGLRNIQLGYLESDLGYIGVSAYSSWKGDDLAQELRNAWTGSIHLAKLTSDLNGLHLGARLNSVQTLVGVDCSKSTSCSQGNQHGLSISSGVLWQTSTGHQLGFWREGIWSNIWNFQTQGSQFYTQEKKGRWIAGTDLVLFDNLHIDVQFWKEDYRDPFSSGGVSWMPLSFVNAEFHFTHNLELLELESLHWAIKTKLPTQDKTLSLMLAWELPFIDNRSTGIKNGVSIFWDI